ncbi:hypothetical protein NCAS_0E01080 [Naumovozyma castellii]|uniref:separase n=1 Tax=Naumovozyma castellii TaxID=27288 RepID=G0VFB3_NAUCA|nr:hypothetical protein NCAS_0E01080 [Naumovozyma castellii CBS 4309]CCC70178.1 hypothetical protein NCAS_0E01080 [Naumovozyma castellii CBS 4309]
MSKQEDPLNEVSLNTTTWHSPSKRGQNNELKNFNAYPNKENIPQLHTGRLEKDLDLYYKQISEFIKAQSLQKPQIERIHAVFTTLYRELNRRHLLRHLRALVKEHLIVVVKLINNNFYDYSQSGILCLYNTTNLFKAHDLKDVILADFSESNEFYLSTLKILSFQVILKKKNLKMYEDTIIQAFSHDERYILKDPNIKIHTVVKLLLNFFSILPTFKTLFGLKFLQYIKQFNLSFQTYIKNMDSITFEKQLVRYGSKNIQQLKPYLNSYYINYSKFNSHLTKLMLTDFVGRDLQSHKKTFALLKDHKEISSTSTECYCCLSHSQMDNFVISCHALMSNNDQIHLHTIDAVTFGWSIIRSENFPRNKKMLALLDSTLIFLNSQMKHLEKMQISLVKLIKMLAEVCMDYQEYKRMTNVINVSFNCFVFFRNFDFLKLTAELESKHYLVCHDKSQWKKLIQKFEKFIGSAPEQYQKIELFSYVFNTFLLFNDDSLSFVVEFTETIFLRCFSRLKLTYFIDFHDVSEPMLSILYGNSSITNIPHGDWNNLTEMLFFCVSGRFEINAININQVTTKWYYLYKYKDLIKSIYVLNLDMKKHSSSNLSQLTSSYISKWVQKTSLLNEGISSIEVTFITMLFQYLGFNNFNKCILTLSAALRDHINYFAPLKLEISRWNIQSSINLQLMEQINDEAKLLSTIAPTYTICKLEKLLTFLEAKLDVFTWTNDYEGFQELFMEELPSVRLEVFDLNNQSKMPASQYIKVLLFMTKLFNHSSRLHLARDDITASVIESKRALKLATSLIKKQNKLSQSSRIRLINLVLNSFTQLIEIYIRLGLAKEADYYADQLSKVICDLGEPSVVYRGLHFLHNYYKLVKHEALEIITLQKANKTFDYLDGESDIESVLMFLFDNSEFKKISESLNLFFQDDFNNSFLPLYWQLKMGRPIDDSLCLTTLKSTNSIKKLERDYKHVLGQLESDPFFKNLFESILAVPAVTNIHNTQSDGTMCLMETPTKKKLAFKVNDSPRPSNMTPKSKNLKQKFDKAVALSNLNRIKCCIEDLNLELLNHGDLLNISSLFSLTVTMLSNISKNALEDATLFQRFNLIDLPKRVPMYYDKLLSSIDDDLYTDIKLLPFSSNHEQTRKKQALLSLNESTEFCGLSFDVITIDICSITGNLLLSKLSATNGHKSHLSIPLNRANLRDLDAYSLTFVEAVKELAYIIDESNSTTSVEVTSSIKTKEDRKTWWKSRYELDNRLSSLLHNIETSWFAGLKGLFDQSVVDPSLFEEFKKKFYGILHSNLPSRKQMGKPMTFLQINDWIIELFLKLDPQDDEFISMIEDMIYFTLDILLFQGEENAYDEIDLSMVHIQLEEQIKRYHSKVISNSHKVDHTFLVIGSACHTFPWESLSFMNDLSLSRIPSIKWLESAITRHYEQLIKGVPLTEKISMILNPHGDLERTELRFRETFETIVAKRPSSSLIVNEKPDEEKMLHMMSNCNLFIYVGHGGGEQYVRTREIKRCDNVGPSFLLGCSSASLKYYGGLEPTGTVNSYLLAGSPLVLGNLWDVTDKDIDKFSQSVFEKIGLVMGEDEIIHKRSISRAVNESRQLCHLKFLNGAAPVVYGLPLHFFT